MQKHSTTGPVLSLTVAMHMPYSRYMDRHMDNHLNKHANEKSVAIQPAFLSVKAAEVYSGLSGWTLRREVYAGRLRAVKFGSRLLIPKQAIDEFMGQLPSAARPNGQTPTE